MSTPKIEFDGELWVPRTMWEKRRQLSAVIQRSLVAGKKMLVLSCDDWSTFFARVDVVPDSELIEYMQVAPLMESRRLRGGTDLSRILGQLSVRFKGHRLGLVIVDDVDLILDLRSEESAVASMFALLYALKARFDEIALFSNPLQSEWEIEYLAHMRDFLAVHRLSPDSKSVA